MDNPHCGLLVTTVAMAQLHRTYHSRLPATHLERLICAVCWLKRHPGAKVINGLGVIRGGLEIIRAGANEGATT